MEDGLYWIVSRVEGLPEGACCGAGGVFVDAEFSGRGAVFADGSAPALIARCECAFGRGVGEAAFVNEVNEALGEAMETQVWLDHALDAGYPTEEMHHEHDRAWQEIGATLQSMIEKSSTFCGGSTP
jgi:four helix bundle protein